MGIFTEKLKPSAKIKDGINNISIKFKALADSADESPVSVTLTIENSSHVHFLDGNTPVHKLTWKETFPTTLDELTKSIKVKADTSGVELPQSYAISLKAESKPGNKAAKINSTIILTS